MLRKALRLYRAGTLGLAVQGEIGSRVSLLGERLRSERLIYNAWTYSGFHRLALEVAPTLVTALTRAFPDVRSVADLGCGTGVYVAELRQRGIEAVGYEYSARAREMARDKLHLQLEPFDVATFRPGRRFDLCLCIEVAEHLPPALGDRLVAVCAEIAPRVVFSAAHPGQGGQGHVNEQPKSYWTERFERAGLCVDEEKTEAIADALLRHLIRGKFLAENLVVYDRGDG